MKTRFLLFLVSSLFLLFNRANAAETEPNNTPATANTLALNGSNSGAITASDVDWYKITTTADGALTLNLTETFGQFASLQLYDADGTTTLGNRIDASNGINSTTIDGLAAGVYYVKINAYYDGQTPVYSVSNTLAVPAQANDVEPNGTAAQALTLGVNATRTGHIGYYNNNQRDTLDWYKVTITADGLIKLNLTSANSNYVSGRLYDADGVTQLGYLEAANSTSTTSVDGLAAGTYYVAINAYYNNQFVSYIITDSLFTPAQANDAEPNGTKALAKTLAINGFATGHIGYYYNHQRDTLDWYKITTTADGLIKLDLTSANNNFVSGRLYDADGTTQLGYLEASNSTTATSVDGLAAGTYYIAINAYFNNQFVPYVIRDSLFTTVPNDAEPDSTKALALPLAVNSSATGHIGYYYNNHRDTLDWYKIVTTKNGAIKLRLTSANGNYVSARLYNEAGDNQLNYLEAANSTSTVTTDGLGAGTYYIQINAYYNNQFAPYTISDSLFTYNPNDTLPNTFFSQAPTIPANRTVTGDVGFLFNTVRDTVDTWKINYTGTSGNLNLTFNQYNHIGDGSISYLWFQVFKDTSAAPIFSNNYATASTAINLTGLSQGYYYIKVFAYYNNQFNAYSITDAFTQVNIAVAAVKSTRPSLDSCGGNSITYTLSKSHSPYGVQLYRNGVKYDSVNVASDSARFNNLPDGNYYATVYGDGATDAAFGTSPTTTFLPPTPKGLTTTNIGVHTATLHWTALSCIKTYRVQYRLSSATNWTTVNDPNDAAGTYALTGLTPYTNYTWRVASADTAQGAEILSPYSDTLLFKTLSDTAHIVKASKTLGTTCSSSTLVYNVTNSINPYTVQLYRYGGVDGSAIQATNTATFSNLPSGVYYATATGTGSGGSIGTSGIDTITPLVPTGLDTGVVTATSAQLTWSPLNCVKYFTLQYKLLNAATWTTMTTTGNVSADTLTKLLPDTMYVWRLASADSANGYVLNSEYSATDTFTTASVLPVTLLSFNAVPVNNTVGVSWQTANETNSKSFTVLRSADGITFLPIGTVAAFGNTSLQHQYSFVDNSPLRGTSYYRLRQMDKDGRFTDSKTVTVSFSGNLLFTLYPNPAVNVVHVTFSSVSAATILVYDANGKAVLQQTINSGAGSQSINVSSLAAGTYTVVLRQNNQQQSLRFVKR